MMLLSLYRQTRPYHFLILLFCSILLGGLTGYLMGPSASVLKPLGDIFLNLIFTFVVPLVFFSVSSAIAGMNDGAKMGKMFISMLGVFLFTSIIAAGYMLVVVSIIPPAQDVLIHLAAVDKPQVVSLASQIVNMFTVSDFLKLFSRENMFALIIFSILVGLATSLVGENGRLVQRFLQSATDVFMKIFSFIMYYAPIGFFAYFAVLVGEMGPKLLETYYRAAAVYYIAGIIYFILVLTCYAFISGKMQAVKRFWGNVSVPAMTALATCSSAATIPANLDAADKIGVPAYIYEVAVPLGTITHKDGSVLGGVIKIAFLFGIFHLSFASPAVLLTALMISMLVGTVMGAIPSGGMVGEMLILSFYGFPPQSLIIIAAISLIIDPLATMLNVSCNTVSSMMITRLLEGRSWMKA
jgi:Na+/H+-dicarboxylate symporter